MSVIVSSDRVEVKANKNTEQKTEAPKKPAQKRKNG